MSSVLSKRLKVRVVEVFLEDSSLRNLNKKPLWSSSATAKALKRGHHVTLEMVDTKTKHFVGPRYSTRSIPGLNLKYDQTAILSVPLHLVHVTVLLVKLYQENKLLGQCPPVHLKGVLTSTATEEVMAIEGRDYKVRLTIEWYERAVAPSQRNLNRKTTASHSRRPDKKGEDEDKPPQSQSVLHEKVDENAEEEHKKKIQELQEKLNKAINDLNQERTEKHKLSEVLKRYRDVDEDARELLGASIDWNQVRNTAQELESRPRGISLSIEESNVSEVTPAQLAALLVEKNRSVLSYLPSIFEKFQHSDASWLKKFLLADGLENIYFLLKYIEDQEPTFTSSLQALQLGKCIKAVMNTQATCEHVVRFHKQVIHNLIELVCFSSNRLLKSFMFTLFAAISIYSSTGNELVIQAFRIKIANKSFQPTVSSPSPVPPSFPSSTSSPSITTPTRSDEVGQMIPSYGHSANRLDFDILAEANIAVFNVLVNILKVERDRELMGSTMAFINSIILGEKELSSRMKIRTFFIKNDILPTISSLKEKLQNEEMMIVQFHVFEEMMKKDEQELRELRFVGNIDLQNSRSLFNSLITNTSALGVDDLLLRHLQHLLLIPHLADDPVVAWRFVERASRRATSKSERKALENLTLKEFNAELYRLHAMEKTIKSKEQKVEFVRRNSHWKKAVSPADDKSDFQHFDISSLKKDGQKPQIGYVYKYEYGTVEEYEEDNTIIKQSPISPSSRKSNIPLPPPLPDLRLPEKDNSSVPEPQTKMKGLFWDTIHTSGTLTNPVTDTFWSGVISPDLTELSDMFQELQELFYAPKEKEKKKKHSLLPLRTANNISILRAQFDMTDDEIIDAVFNIEETNTIIETHHFQALLNCIPTDAEAAPLRAYTGSIQDLVVIDRFALSLLSVPHITQKLRAMIYWDEFDNRISMTREALIVMKKASEDIINSPKLKQVIGIVLSIGNFMNAGTTRGKATGFKASTLQKIMDIKSAEDKEYSLLAFIAGFIESNFKHLVDFTKEILAVEKAMKYQPELIQEEIEALEHGLEEIFQQIDEATEDDLSPTSQFYQFFDAMILFSDYARAELDAVATEWSAFEDSAEKLLKTFEEKAQQNEHLSAVKAVWGNFSLFATKFEEALEDQHQKQQEIEHMKQLQEYWMREGVNKNKNKPLPVEEKPVPEVFGLLDKLISSIRQGKFSVHHK